MSRTKGATGKNKKYNIKEMVEVITNYTKKTNLPILKECCLENQWDYDYLMQLQREHQILRCAIKEMLMKKEIMLEKALYTGENNTGFIFSLKQLGWKDNPEPIIVNNTIQNNQGGNRSKKLQEVSTETLIELEKIYEQIEEKGKKSE